MAKQGLTTIKGRFTELRYSGELIRVYKFESEMNGTLDLGVKHFPFEPDPTKEYWVTVSISGRVSKTLRGDERLDNRLNVLRIEEVIETITNEIGGNPL